MTEFVQATITKNGEFYADILTSTGNRMTRELKALNSKTPRQIAERYNDEETMGEIDSGNNIVFMINRNADKYIVGDIQS